MGNNVKNYPSVSVSLVVLYIHHGITNHRFYVDPKTGLVYSYPDETKINIREICDSLCVMSASAIDNGAVSDPIQLSIVPVREDEVVALEVTDGGVNTGAPIKHFMILDVLTTL